MELQGSRGYERMPDWLREMVPAHELVIADQPMKDRFWNELIENIRSTLDVLPALKLEGNLQGPGLITAGVSVKRPNFPLSYTNISLWHARQSIDCIPREDKRYSLRYIAWGEDAVVVDNRCDGKRMNPEQACECILKPLIQFALANPPAADRESPQP